MYLSALADDLDRQAAELESSDVTAGGASES